jgi:demethylmenaquinone methyltransferase/2-methoxy-6-polyprenyl-1,4-benzoquinol methylase
MSEQEDEQIARVLRSRQTAAEWYDTLSPWYDTLVDPFERTYRSKGVELLSVKRGEQIADLGSGTGNALIPIADSVGENGRVIGIDIAEGMCQQVQQNVATTPVADRIDVVRGDTLSLPVRSGSLDALFLSFTLELFDTPDIPVVLDECKRVLGDAGRLCVVSLSKRNAAFLTGLYERIHAAIPQYVDCRPIYPQQHLRTAGFEISESQHERMWGLSLELVLAHV